MKKNLKIGLLSMATLFLGYTSQAGPIQATEKPVDEFVPTTTVETEKFTDLMSDKNATQLEKLRNTLHWRYNNDLTDEGDDTSSRSGKYLSNYAFRGSHLDDSDSKDLTIYCLDYGKLRPTELRKGNLLDIRFQRVLKAGYPNKKASDYKEAFGFESLTDLELEWATSVALHIVNGKGWVPVEGDDEKVKEGIGLSLDQFTDPNLGDNVLHYTHISAPGYIEGFNEAADKQMLAPRREHADKLLELIKALVAKADDESVVPTTISIDASKAKELVQHTGSNKSVSGPFRLDYTSDVEDVNPTFTLVKDGKVVENFKLLSSEFKDLKGKESDLLEGGDFYVETEIEGDQDTFNYTLKVELDVEEVAYYEYLPEDPENYQRMAIAEIVKPSAETDFTVVRHGLEFIKLDKATNKPLEGIVFGLYDEAGKLVTLAKTQGNGSLKFENLIPGNYKLVEEELLSGYIRLQALEFTLTENGQIEKDGKVLEDIPKLYNEKNRIEIVKVDLDGNILEGAEFLITNTVTKETIEGVWIDGKYVLEGLAHGTYTIVETKAPKGYILDKTVHKFNVDENGNIVGEKSIEIVNKKNKLIINKFDSKDGSPLSDTVFELIDKDGNVTQLTTDENGKIVLEGLAPGTYTLVETKAKEGYEKTERTFKFIVGEDGMIRNEKEEVIQTIEVGNSKLEEPKFEVHLVKVDENGNKLPGASVIITNKDTGNIVYQGELGEDGIFLELKPGTYAITEVIAPEGYIISEGELIFTIDKDGNHEGLINVNDILSYELVNKKAPEKPVTPTSPVEPTNPGTPNEPVDTSDIITTGGAAMMMSLVGSLFLIMKVLKKKD